jgi:hypothetical protein
MDAELRAYLDRRFDAIGEHFEVLEARLGARIDALNAV